MHTLINEIPTDYITSIDSLMVLPSISFASAHPAGQ